MQPNVPRKPVLPATKLPPVVKGQAPRLPMPPKIAAPKPTSPKPTQLNRVPPPGKPAAPASKAPVTSRNQAPAPQKPTAPNLSAPKLADLPAAHLPKLGNRFVAVKVGVAIPSNARQSRKIVERNAQHGGASTNAAKASVVLFDPKHLDTLRNVRSNTMAYLNDIGLKTSDGHYIVHASRAKTLLEMGVAAEQAYREAAAEFVANYESYCEQWSANLGDDYDPKLYPPVDKIARQVGINVGQTGNTTNKKRGFVFAMNMINEHDETLESEMGLSLTDDEREFIAQGARAHYQSVVDQAFGQLQEAMAKIVEGDQPGRRVRKAAIDHAHAIASKIEDMGLDSAGIAARAREITETPAPERKGRVDKKGTPIDNSAREAYIARTRAVLDDLAALDGN